MKSENDDLYRSSRYFRRSPPFFWLIQSDSSTLRDVVLKRPNRTRLYTLYTLLIKRALKGTLAHLNSAGFSSYRHFAVVDGCPASHAERVQTLLCLRCIISTPQSKQQFFSIIKCSLSPSFKDTGTSAFVTSTEIAVRPPL